MELPLEDVIRLVELVGFVVEKQEAKKGIRYTADDLGASSSLLLVVEAAGFYSFSLVPN